MATQQTQQTGMSSADGSVVVTDNEQENMMNEVVTSGALRANWYRRGIAGVAAVLTIGAISIGVSSVEPAGGRSIVAGAPETGIAAPAALAVSERYRRMKDEQVARQIDLGLRPLAINSYLRPGDECAGRRRQRREQRADPGEPAAADRWNSTMVKHPVPAHTAVDAMKRTPTSASRADWMAGITGRVEAGLHTECLTLSYGAACAFEDITFTMQPGAITAIIGPSGCGITSFLCCLNRLTDLIADCRVSGAIHLGGSEVLSPRTDVIALRRRVGMIFQKPNPFPLSIRRNIDFPLREHGMRDRAQRQATVERVLHDIGLWTEMHDRLDTSALALSGGQQQRLCFARALALEPEVLLLDEPCSALDPLASGVVEDLILQLRGRYTIVIVTHNLGQARRLAEEVGFFSTVQGVGKLIEHGPIDQLFKVPQAALTADYVRGVRS